MNIAKDQLFCLLGPNGAGKTPTISCLTGINPVTGGDGKYLFREEAKSSQSIFNHSNNIHVIDLNSSYIWRLHKKFCGYI